MTNHQTDAIEIANQPPLWLPSFTPKIEALYRKRNIEQNHSQVAITWLIGVFLYDSFIISDYVVASQYLNLFVIGRFLVVTPICIAAAALILIKNSYYDLWVSIIPMAMTGVLSGLIMLTDGDFRTHYMFGNILLMLCGCVIGRPRTIYGIAVVMLQFLFYLFVLYNTNFISELNKPVSILFCMSGAVISIVTVYAMEKFNRNSFLMGLRIELLNQELEVQSLTDPLTKLANRRSFERATTRHWDDHSLRFEPVSLVLIDIDCFKLYNDSYGHSAGDRCLLRVASCVAAEMPRDKGLAVRFGGEEIVLFLPSKDFTDAREIAERIRLSILHEAIPHAVEKPNAIVSASFGVATATADDCDPAELVIRADTALYAAKRSGRNQVWPPLRQAVKEPEPIASIAANVA